MYANLPYNAPDANTAANLVSDVVKVLTGTTDKTQLSSSINQAGASIVSTIPGGWTLHDDVNSLKKVVKAPISDDPSKFKYVLVESSSGIIFIESYKSWNNVSHTGVKYKRFNGATEQTTVGYNTSNMIAYAIGAGNASGSIYISSSANHVAGMAVYNTGGAVYGLSLITERTRMSPWDTVANGYDPIVYTCNNIGGGEIGSNANRFLNSPVGPLTSTTDFDFSSASNPAGMMYLSSSVSATIGLTTTNATINIPNAVLNSAKSSVVPLVSFGCHSMANGNFGGEISAKCNIYLCPSLGQNNDLITVGGINYRVWASLFGDSSGFYLAVKEA